MRYISVFLLLQQALDDALLILHDHVKTLEDSINPFHTEQSSIIPSPEDYLPDTLPDSLPVRTTVHILLIIHNIFIFLQPPPDTITPDIFNKCESSQQSCQLQGQDGKLFENNSSYINVYRGNRYKLPLFFV